MRNIQGQTQSWVGLKLFDHALSSQFDRLFRAAIDTAGRNNSPGVVAAVKDMRKLLKKEHEDVDSDGDDDKDDAKAKNQRALIDKLAARVLDFDLKFVSKRLGGMDD